MGVAGTLSRLAVRHAHVLLVEVPGHWLTRVAAERYVLRRGWRLAISPADADILAVCGPPGQEQAELVARLWDELPGPRARADIDSPDAVPSALAAAEADLLDVARQGADSRDRPTGVQHDMGHAGHGGMGHGDHGATGRAGHGGEEHAGHEGMDHAGHEGMDHGGHEAMEHGGHGREEHAGHGEAGRDGHGDMEASGPSGTERAGHEGMDHGGHKTMEHGIHGGMGHGGQGDMAYGGHRAMGHGGHGGPDAMDHDAHAAMEHAGHDAMTHGGMAHGGHGGMDHGGMEMAPAGIPLAQGGEDRDGLEMDLLHVRLGPVLPYWPAGLVLRCTLQGDVITDAESGLIDAGHAGQQGGPAGEREHAARRCDNAANLLALAGWADAASRARRIRDALVDGDPTAATGDLDGLRRTVRRSWLLRWSLRRVGPLTGRDLAHHGLPERLQGDAWDRLLTMLEGAARSIAGQAGQSAADQPHVTPVEAIAELVRGWDLAAARLIVASLDLDVLEADREVSHV